MHVFMSQQQPVPPLQSKQKTYPPPYDPSTLRALPPILCVFYGTILCYTVITSKPAQLHANDHASVMQQMLKKDNDCTSRFPLSAVQTPLLHTWGGRSVQGSAGKVSEFN